MSTQEFHVLVGLMLFCIGIGGFVARRNGLIALMCLELMLNGINLCLVSFSRLHANSLGSVLILFVVLVAAAEAAVGLSLLVALFKAAGTVNLDEYRELKG